jgi:hypothetical protein
VGRYFNGPTKAADGLGQLYVPNKFDSGRPVALTPKETSPSVTQYGAAAAIR